MHKIAAAGTFKGNTLTNRLFFKAVNIFPHQYSTLYAIATLPFSLKTYT